MRNTTQNSFSPLRFSTAVAIVGWLVVAIGWSTPAFAQPNERIKFPYQALVLMEDSTVHSGPGDVHYATAALREGAAVEVYRHDPGGWCAIRPGDGSFSLIPESTLQIVADGVGEILENGTQAWVGTKLGAVEKPLWQIKLQKGERVEVLGQVSWPNPEGHSTVWYQISPPPGEFRWIRMSDIQLPSSAARTPAVPEQHLDLGTATQLASKDNPSGLGRRQEFDNRNPAPSQTVRSLNDIVAKNLMAHQTPTIDRANYGQAAGTRDLVQQAALEIDPPRRSNPPPQQPLPNRGWRQSKLPVASRMNSGFNPNLGSNREAYPNDSSQEESNRRFLQGNDDPGFTNNATPYGAMGDDTDRVPANSIPDSPVAPRQRYASADLSAPNLAKEMSRLQTFGALPGSTVMSRNLDELELKLTQEMLKATSAWQLNDLENAANGLLRSATSQQERMASQRYLLKIASCKEVQAGYTSNGLAAGNLNGTIGSGLTSDVGLGTMYDAHGWLTEMVRDSGNSQSSYALQDASGKITHHISPAPGLNLHRYLKTKVGIIGQRGYHSKLKLDHVTAHRVISLEEPNTIRR